MKIKIDENLPVDLANALKKLGHDADTVRDEALSGKEDPEIWQAAQKEKRFLVTLDLYFADIRNHPPGGHCGVLLLRLPEADRDAVIKRTIELFSQADLSAWNGANVVATSESIRVRK